MTIHASTVAHAAWHGVRGQAPARGRLTFLGDSRDGRVRFDARGRDGSRVFRLTVEVISTTLFDPPQDRQPWPDAPCDSDCPWDIGRPANTEAMAVIRAASAQHHRTPNVVDEDGTDIAMCSCGELWTDCDVLVAIEAFHRARSGRA